MTHDELEGRLEGIEEALYRLLADVRDSAGAVNVGPRAHDTALRDVCNDLFMAVSHMLNERPQSARAAMADAYDALLKHDAALRKENS